MRPTTGFAAAQLIMLGSAGLSSVIYARALGPYHQGIYELIVSTITFLGFFLGLGYASYAVVAAGRLETRPESLLGSSILLSGLVGVLSFAAGLLLWPVLRVGVLAGLSFGLAAVTFATVGLSVLGACLQELYLGLRQVRILSVSLVSVRLACDIGGVVAILGFHTGLAGVVAVTVLNAVAVPAVLGGWLMLHRVRPHFDTATLWRGLSYGLRKHLGLVAGFLLLRIDVFTLNAFRGPSGVGVYSVAVSIVEAIWVVTTTFARVSYGAVSGEDSVGGARVAAWVSRSSVVFAVCIAVVVGLVSEPLIPILFGHAYAHAYMLLLLLLPGVVIQLVARAVDAYVAGNRDRPLVTSGIGLASLVVAVPVYIGFIRAWGDVGAALASTVVYAAYAAISWFVYRQMAGDAAKRLVWPYRSDWRDLYRSISENEPWGSLDTRWRQRSLLGGPISRRRPARSRRDLTVVIATIFGLSALGALIPSSPGWVVGLVVAIAAGSLCLVAGPGLRLGVFVALIPFMDYLGTRLRWALGPASPYRLLAFALIAGGLIVRRYPPGHARANVRPFVIAGALLAGLMFVSMITQSIDQGTARTLITDVVLFPTGLYATFATARWAKRDVRILQAFAFGALVAETLLGLAEFFGHSYPFFGRGQIGVRTNYTAQNVVSGLRAVGSFPAPEPYAAVTGAFAIFLAGTWWKTGRPLRAYLALTLGLACILVSGERGILIFYLVATGYLSWRSNPQARRQLRRLAIAGGVGGVGLFLSGAGLLSGSGFIQERLHNTASIYARFATYRLAVGLTLSHPIRGVGLANFQLVTTQLAFNTLFHGVHAVPEPHNTFLALGAETGLPGLALFIWWLRSVVTGQRGLPSHKATFAIVGFVAGGMLTVNNGYYSSVIAAMLTMAAASTVLSHGVAVTVGSEGIDDAKARATAPSHPHEGRLLVGGRGS